MHLFIIPDYLYLVLSFKHFLQNFPSMKKARVLYRRVLSVPFSYLMQLSGQSGDADR